MTQPRSGDLVVLPPVAADPVFSEPLPLAELIPSPRLGSDPQDFAALFIRHKWSFSLHARRFLSDQRDIDEVVQEAFLRLFLAMPELGSELQALAYCRRTITNLCIDRYRADQRRPRMVDLESVPVDVLSDDEPADPVVQAEDAAIVRGLAGDEEGRDGALREALALYERKGNVVGAGRVRGLLSSRG